MDADQVSELYALENRLKSHGRDLSAAIAHRSAMRVAPLCFVEAHPVSSDASVDLLPVLRSALISTLSGRLPTKDIVDLNEVFEFEVYNLSYDLPGGSAYAVRSILFAAETAGQIILGEVVESALNCVEMAASAVFEAEGSSQAVWKALQKDLESLEAGCTVNELCCQPLWPKGHRPELWGWQHIDQYWASAPTSWAFWHLWYQKIELGGGQDWQLLADVALLPAYTWQLGNTAVDKAISEILDSYNQIKDLEDRTPNGELILLDASSGLLTSFPVAGSDRSLAEHIVGRLFKAIDRFNSFVETNTSNLGPVLKDCAGQDLEFLREDLEDNRSYDLGLHDAIEDCLVSIREKFDRERIADEPNATRLVRVLERATVDIYACSPSAREVLERRGEEYYRRIKLEQHLQFNDLCMSMAQQSDAPLRKAMERDVQLADDETASEAVRRRARYNTISRLPRGARAVHYSRFKDGEKVVPDQPQPDRTWVKVVLGQAGIEILKWYLQG